MSVLHGYYDPDKDYDYTYLALGAGVQSTALLLMCDKGLFNAPRPDVAIFSDTQSEPGYITEQVEALRAISSIPVVTVTAGNLGEDYIRAAVHGEGRASSIPCFTKDAADNRGMIQRQCTRDYKVDPIEKWVRKSLGYQPRQRIKESVRCLMGISLEEASRMKPSRTGWIDNQYPLVDERIRRDQCLDIVAEHDWPTPQKSACIFCPFRSNAGWQYYKERQPEIFAEAVAFDKAIRKQVRLRADAYLHRSCKPLDEIDFTGGQLTFDFFQDECEGHCGV
ncbi:hypothetical protein CMI37_03690 [Candidatus Pacearchaeota archaeon]|nr:hypothetical protein [Candidatus Pacearchaeota archaeon]